MDLIWIIENQRSEKSRNEHFGENLQIDLSNDIQILKFIYQQKSKNQMILKRPKWSNSDLYFESNWPLKSMLIFGLKMNSAWSNVKLRSQMISEFDEFAIHRKLMKQGIQWNQNQVIRNYNQRDILAWKSTKIHE